LRIAGLPENAPPRPGTDHFRFAPGDLTNYAHLDDAEIVALHLWVGCRLRPTAIDESAHEVRLAKAPRRRLTETFAAKPFARYRVENARELLDAPGEWYCDRATGVLTYLPKSGESPESAAAVVPAVPQLLRLEGRPNAPVHHVTFRGLTFAHWERWPDRTDTCDTQAAADVPAGVHAEYARDCAFERCMVTRGGGYGLHLARGCRSCRVERCELTDLGAGGVKFGEMQVPKNDADLAAGNAITDCTIRDGGKVFPQAVGVWVGQSPDNRIAHNHIHHLTYSGVSVGWTWGYGPARAGGNVVEANRIHDIGAGLLSDMAGVHTLGSQPGTAIRGNVIHDVAAFQYGGWGVYFDEGSTGVVAEGNLVYRTTHGGFHQHYGKDNLVRNNVFACGRDAQVRRTRPEAHRSFTFERNVVYWTTGKLLDGRWDDGHVLMERNLYWRPGGDARFGTLTLAEWQAKGRDSGSLVADPLFMDPERDDFRLRPDSPAGRVGLVPPDWSRAGPRR
jgi:hypothetical protein